MHTPPLVLLADDESEILDIYSLALQQAGLDVATVSNGEECVKLANERQPDLILLDMKMPILDGAEALHRLKEDPKTKNIKVVFLTAFSDPKLPEVDVAFAKEVGAIDFIRKGIALDQLVNRVKGYIELPSPQG